MNELPKEPLEHQEGGKPTASRRSDGEKPLVNRRSVSCPPYNPGLQHLVEGKRAWTGAIQEEPNARGFLGWHQRGYLPHYDAPGLRQFVTFRLHDSFPASRQGEWEAMLRIEDNRQRRKKLEEYLDRGHGECWLRQPGIAALTERALRHFDRERYQLLAWTVMPNHVHVLVKIGPTPLARVVQTWKRFIACEANKLLGHEGTFWEREYWDTCMRDDAQVVKAERYVEQNPVKAGLVREAKDWPWSSACFRDDYGRLIIPEERGKPTANPPPDNDDACTPERRLEVGFDRTINTNQAE